MKRINMNILAKQVILQEGKKVSVNIAQVKEILNITFSLLIDYYDASEWCELIERYKE